MAIDPATDWTTRVRFAKNLNALSLYSRALGTILIVLKNRLTESTWQMIAYTGELE